MQAPRDSFDAGVAGSTPVGACIAGDLTGEATEPTSGRKVATNGFQVTNGAFPPTNNRMLQRFPSQNIDRHECLFRNGKMDSHKDKPGNAPQKVPPQVETDLRSNVKIVQSKFVFSDDLSIADDDRGGDPYNSTGAHCIIKPKDIAGE